MAKDLDILLIEDVDARTDLRKRRGVKDAADGGGMMLVELLVLAVQWLASQPRLALALVSAQSKAAGHSVEYIYRPLLPWRKKAFRRLLERKPKVAGITTIMLFKPASVARLVDEIRRISPGTVIVLGGHGAADYPEIRALGDLFISGHGEWAFASLVTALKTGVPLDKVPGVSAAHEGGRTMAGSLRYEGIPRVLPPDWTASDTGCRRYPVEASRGCRFNCSYCCFPGKGGQVFREVGDIVAEIRSSLEGRGISRFEFIDSSLTSDEKFITGLCAALRREKLNIDWKCFARPDAFERVPGLAAEMAAAGCSKVFMGVESIHDHILRGMRRGMDRAAIERALARVFGAGIKVHGNFIIGFPGETEATVRETAEFIKSRPFKSIYLSTFGMSQEMLELAAAEPERYAHLTGTPTKGWRHDTMDYREAYRLTVWATKDINASRFSKLVISPVTNAPDHLPA